jgi:hypothetical protein
VTFWRNEGFVWWIAHGPPRKGDHYHRGPLPQGPEYSVHIIPNIRHGTVEEAAEAGYTEPCMAGACGDAEQRRMQPGSRWQRGGRVRR